MLEDGSYVALVDAGDAIQGDAIGALTEGEYMVDLMNRLGYAAAVPGNHEFDYGMGPLFWRSQRQKRSSRMFPRILRICAQGGPSLTPM